MTTTFTATNGVTVTIDDNGYLLATADEMCHATGGADLGVQALREYFQHRRDVELGRWRDEENPNMVVYPVPENDDKDGRAVRVIDEATGAYASLWERDVKHFERGSMYATAARYFEQHPEPKPWQAAKPGEVWVLDIKNDLGREAPAVVNGQPEFRTYLGEYFDLDSPQIVHARKIWPEESDDE